MTAVCFDISLIVLYPFACYATREAALETPICFDSAWTFVPGTRPDYGLASDLLTPARKSGHARIIDAFEPLLIID
jgi:hypothetical protein